MGAMNLGGCVMNPLHTCEVGTIPDLDSSCLSFRQVHACVRGQGQFLSKYRASRGVRDQ